MYFEGVIQERLQSILKEKVMELVVTYPFIYLLLCT